MRTFRQKNLDRDFKRMSKLIGIFFAVVAVFIFAVWGVIVYD